MFKYLANNWKHIAAAIITIAVNILIGKGTISPQVGGYITTGMLAVGLATTTNSGTKTPTPQE